MVLLPTAHGWQASVRGYYRGSRFSFLFLVGDHLVGMQKLRSAMVEFFKFIDEGEPS